MSIFNISWHTTVTKCIFIDNLFSKSFYNEIIMFAVVSKDGVLLMKSILYNGKSLLHSVINKLHNLDIMNRMCRHIIAYDNVQLLKSVLFDYGEWGIYNPDFLMEGILCYDNVKLFECMLQAIQNHTIAAVFVKLDLNECWFYNQIIKKMKSAFVPQNKIIAFNIASIIDKMIAFGNELNNHSVQKCIFKLLLRSLDEPFNNIDIISFMLKNGLYFFDKLTSSDGIRNLEDTFVNTWADNIVMLIMIDTGFWDLVAILEYNSSYQGTVDVVKIAFDNESLGYFIYIKKMNLWQPDENFINDCMFQEKKTLLEWLRSEKEGELV